MDPDRDQDEPERERGQTGEVAREAAEGESESGDEQPPVEREADDPSFRRDRDRGRVRRAGFRVAALQVLLVGVGTLEAAQADARDGMVDSDVDSGADELATPARRVVQAAAVAEDVVAHVRHRQRPRGRDEGDQHRERKPLAAPREDRGEDDSGDERREARLRVREQEAGPDDGDRGGAADEHAPVPAEEHRDEAGENRNDQEAAVDRGIPEDRVDAVEGRVGIADLDLRVPEDIARLVLVDPDRSEDERHRRDLDEQAKCPEPAPREPREHECQQPERQVEEEQVDRALPEVVRPEHRQAAPGDEEGERPGDRAELAGAGVTLEQLPGDQQRGRRDHRVERNEQVGLGRADGDVDPGGDAREHDERQHERPAPEPGGARGCEQHAHDRGPGEQGPVAVRREVDRQEDDADGPGSEPGEAQVAARREDQHREPRGSEHASRAGELRGHGTTTTLARATCPLAATRSTYVPGAGARRTNSRPLREACSGPR